MSTETEFGKRGALPDKYTVGIDEEKDGQDGYEVEVAESIEDAAEQGENRDGEAKDVDREEIAEIRSEIGAMQKKAELQKVALSAEQKIELDEKIIGIKKKSNRTLPAVAAGNKTATEYDSRAGNYSTTTSIIELSDGTKLFVIHNYAASRIHRALDTFMKRVTGSQMKKADHADWKQAFESKSRIPTIPYEDKNTVVLPFLPNVNLGDLFRYKDEIENFGECEFASGMDTDGLLGVVDKVVDEVEKVHQGDVAWGELILPNIIIDKEQKIHICDPEVTYDEGMPLPEQKARDLYDLIFSISAVLDKYNVDYQVSVQRVLLGYGDQEVIAELKKLASKKPKLLEKIFFGYTQARLGLKNKKQWQDIRTAIVNS